jgi:hypothetical protein
MPLSSPGIIRKPIVSTITECKDYPSGSMQFNQSRRLGNVNQIVAHQQADAGHGGSIENGAAPISVKAFQPINHHLDPTQHLSLNAAIGG